MEDDYKFQDTKKCSLFTITRSQVQNNGPFSRTIKNNKTNKEASGSRPESGIARMKNASQMRANKVLLLVLSAQLVRAHDPALTQRVLTEGSAHDAGGVGTWEKALTRAVNEKFAYFERGSL